MLFRSSLIDGGVGGSRVAGVTVTEKTALQVSTVLACVKAIADGCATPKLHVYREVTDNNGRSRRERATNIPEYRLLARRPNEWQTSFEFRRMLTAHAALCGTGLAYLPVETPTSDFYGGHRHGNNLFAESIVAVDVKTGVRKWHYQLVHHGIWDMDIPCAAILTDITVNGRRTKAVVQVTKQAFAFVFDRVTGTPVWPIEERPVPPSTVPSVLTSAGSVALSEATLASSALRASSARFFL